MSLVRHAKCKSTKIYKTNTFIPTINKIYNFILARTHVVSLEKEDNDIFLTVLISTIKSVKCKIKSKY